MTLEANVESSKMKVDPAKREHHVSEELKEEECSKGCCDRHVANG
jgi:hypothetical protein